MKIKIITDSTSDITRESAEKSGVEVLPIGIEIEGQYYSEGIDITAQEFYNKLRVISKLPHTSQITAYSFSEIIEKDKATDTFFCILPISKDLSNTYYSAESAIKEYPNEKIYLCETSTATVGLAMLVDYAVSLSQKDDMTPEMFIREMESFKKRIRVFAIISDLKYLKMGGRLSSGAALVGSLLKITPLVTIDGKVKIASKHIGLSKAYAELARLASERDGEYPVYIGHTDCKKMMDDFLNKEANELMCDGREKLFDIGAAIGSHAGPGAVAIAFIAK